MSKQLEMLKDLKNAFIGHCTELKCETNYIRVCENKFAEIEKELKAYEELEEQLPIINKYIRALEIIKEKNINVRGIINSPTLEYYIDHCMPRHSEEPTQEEYDLLKEVL